MTDLKKRVVDYTTKDLDELLTEKLEELTQKYQEQLLGLLNSNTKSHDEERLLSIDETAKFFDVTRATIHEWVKKGILKKYKQGNRTYFIYSEVIESLKASNNR